MTVDKMTKTASEELKRECAGIPAPEGWKFQNCGDNFVTLLRQSRVEWAVEDWRNLEEPLKDNYIAAERHEDYPFPGMTNWEVYAFDKSEGHGPGPSRGSRGHAVKELVCLAKMDNKREYWKDRGLNFEDRSQRAQDFLESCRRESGLQ